MSQYDNIPWWIALPAAIALWATYVIIVRVQNSRDSK